MKIIIAGGNGFLGKALEKYFIEEGHEVYVLTRKVSKRNQIQWTGNTLGSWQTILEGADVLINLCGKSVDCRYTTKNKRKILQSRVDTTNILQKAISTLKLPPRIWLNASSATIYIHSENIDMTERNGITGDDFSMGVCKAWEEAFFSTPIPLVRKVALRSAIVMANGGGAFLKLRRLSQLGLGGPQGNGRQFFSWIHLTDFCRAIDFIVDRESIHGPVNICSPFPIPNRDLMNVLSDQTKPPIKIPLPIKILELGALIIQTETELILKSRRVVPEILLAYGFEFKFPNINQAIKDLCKLS